jgi:anti-sigma factor RsiW
MAGREPVSTSVRCERARQWTSLRLDGELSALEDQLLERHLATCASCHAFAARVEAGTALLRGAPPETPRRRFRALPARTVRLFGARRTALVAAVALVLGAVTGSLLHRSPEAPAPSRPQQFSLLSRDVKQLRQLPRVKERTTPAPQRSGPPNPPEGVI